jgi:hypothetical protein
MIHGNRGRPFGATLMVRVRNDGPQAAGNLI